MKLNIPYLINKIQKLSFLALIIFLLFAYFPCDSVKFKVKEAPIKQPVTLNVTYETPMRDLDEERKYTMEEINYGRKVRRLEQKFSEDIELLKMVINVQNIQFDKLNEIVMVNHEIAKELLGSNKKIK